MICALIATLAALFGSTVRTHFLRRKMRRIEKIVDGYFLLAFSELLGRVALADGKVTEDEFETVRAMFDGMKLSQAERAMCVGNFVLIQKGRQEACGGARALAAALNPPARTFLYALLWRVANADRCVSAGERRVLDEIAAMLKLDAADLSRIHAGEMPKPDRKSLDEAGVPASLSHLVASTK